MTGKEKFISIAYFTPILLLLLPIQPPQAPTTPEIKAEVIETTKAPEIILEPITTPTLDIQKGRHGTTDDERAEIKKEVVKRWDESQWLAFEQLVQNESGWIAGNKNKSSGACGLGQALPCSKYPGELGDAIAEANWMLDYIANRYKTPENALNFWKSKSPHWY